MHPATAPPRTTTAAAAPAIEVTDLRRRHRDVDAVCGISFEVRPGEVLALLGVNGAGKTSTLEVLEGPATPSAGSAAGKLGAANRHAAVDAARRHGWIRPTGGGPRSGRPPAPVGSGRGTGSAPRPGRLPIGTV